jgi:nucleotide-binding universal stress UspA family protein
MYGRILLAYDGTREGAIALREGALLAKQCGAKVYVLSVLPDTEGVLMAEGVYGDVVGQQMDEYRSVLERGVAVLQRLGVDSVAKLVVGEPAPCIGAYAKEVKADLLVLGHRRKNLLQRWWSGGTGAYITDHVACSVLIARSVISDEVFEAELSKSAAS